MDSNRTVAVLGASSKEERYSHQAVKLLLEKGFNTIPVNPAGIEICGIRSSKSLDEIKEKVDVLTMYVNRARSSDLQDAILNLAPGKIIFNPGAENEELAEVCRENGIEVENACTLILLKSEQF